MWKASNSDKRKSVGGIKDLVSGGKGVQPPVLRQESPGVQRSWMAPLGPEQWGCRVTWHYQLPAKARHQSSLPALHKHLNVGLFPGPPARVQEPPQPQLSAASLPRRSAGWNPITLQCFKCQKQSQYQL